jgi:hypothetical protein
VLPVEVKLDLGTAIRHVMGGDADEADAEAMLTPSDDGDQGLNTLTHDLDRKSQIRIVPSSEPLARRGVAFKLAEEAAKSVGSSKANDRTAFTCPFNSDTYLF